MEKIKIPIHFPNKHIDGLKSFIFDFYSYDLRILFNFILLECFPEIGCRLFLLYKQYFKGKIKTVKFCHNPSPPRSKKNLLFFLVVL